MFSCSKLGVSAGQCNDATGRSALIPSLVMGGAEHVLTSLVTAKRLTPYPQSVVNLMKGGPYADPF
jgi:hypothetical protein